MEEIPPLLRVEIPSGKRAPALTLAEETAGGVMHLTSIVQSLTALNLLAQRWLSPLQAPFALLARVYVSWQFLKSGYIKVTSWDTTLYLFENEYHTPLLSPHVAAVAGSIGELFFPLLLVVGLFGRLSAIGLFFVNAVAVVSYSQFLFAEGHEAALGQHILWGSIAAYLVVHGPGTWSLDSLLERFAPPAVRSSLVR